jgi:predicted nucleic acid-binding protein
MFQRADFGLSGQVLAEFVSVAGGRLARAVPFGELDDWLAQLGQFPVVPVDVELVNSGLFFARRYQINYYDGAILAAAERLGAPILYTEDLAHEQHYGPVQVINPFLES